MEERKRNRLPCYDYSQPGAYFVTVCVKNREHILGEKVQNCRGRCPHRPNTEDYGKIILSPIGKIAEKYIKTMCGVQKYIIMPNHIHFMIVLDGSMWASTPTIPSIVRSFKTLVTKEIGYSIWQRSYYDHIIRNEEDFFQHIQYIEENPKKWKNDKYF